MITLQDRLQPVEIKASDLLLEYGPCPAYRTESGRIMVSSQSAETEDSISVTR